MKIYGEYISTLTCQNYSRITFNSLSNNMHPGNWDIQAVHASSSLLPHIIM